MKRRSTESIIWWYLGATQYCLCLFAGGALWLVAAIGTGFFWDDLPAQISACLLLLLVIAAETWWAHMPASDSQTSSASADLFVDFLSSAAIAAFGMSVVLVVLLWLPR